MSQGSSSSLQPPSSSKRSRPLKEWVCERDLISTSFRVCGAGVLLVSNPLESPSGFDCFFNGDDSLEHTANNSSSIILIRCFERDEDFSRPRSTAIMPSTNFRWFFFFFFLSDELPLKAFSRQWSLKFHLKIYFHLIFNQMFQKPSYSKYLLYHVMSVTV